jgi:hypothetical protein
MRKYVPNDRDRQIVLRMAAIPGVTRDDIAFCVTNERTGRPINRRTLEKVYRKELETGMAVMKQLTMKSFVEQIQQHVWPATRLALSNYCGLKDGADVVANISNQNINAEIAGIEVRFVQSPFATEPVPAVDSYDMELQSTKPPPLLPAWQQQDAQLREASAPSTAPVANNGPSEPTFRKHELPPEFAPPPRAEPIPVTGPYRTELDIPNNPALVPWHKRKLTGKLR